MLGTTDLSDFGQQPVVEVETVALRSLWVSAARRRAAGDAGASSRSGDAADGPIPPQPEGRQGVTVLLPRYSSSPMAPHRLLIAPCMRTVRPCRAAIWTSTTGC